MKKTIIFLTLTLGFFTKTFGQECLWVDSVYSTSKIKDKLGKRDVRFGIKQITEEELGNKFCLSENGNSVNVEVHYFGTPKTTLRVMGVEKTDSKTQVGVKIHYKSKVYEGYGESEVEIRTILSELTDNSVIFNGTTFSNALKKAIQSCVSKM